MKTTIITTFIALAIAGTADAQDFDIQNKVWGQPEFGQTVRERNSNRSWHVEDKVWGQPEFGRRIEPNQIGEPTYELNDRVFGQPEFGQELRCVRNCR